MTTGTRVGPAGSRCSSPGTAHVSAGTRRWSQRMVGKTTLKTTAPWEAYGMFFAAYRVAAEKLKEGDWTAVFPPGSFPPRLPVVTA